MKFRVTFKDPNALFCPEGAELSLEAMRKACGPWLKYGEYLTVEFDTEDGSFCRVIPVQEPEPEFKCSKCGGINVQHAMWVQVNTNQVLDFFGTCNHYGSSFCEDCEDHTELE